MKSTSATHVYTQLEWSSSVISPCFKKASWWYSTLSSSYSTFGWISCRKMYFLNTWELEEHPKAACPRVWILKTWSSSSRVFPLVTGTNKRRAMKPMMFQPIYQEKAPRGLKALSISGQEMERMKLNYEVVEVGWMMYLWGSWRQRLLWAIPVIEWLIRHMKHMTEDRKQHVTAPPILRDSIESRGRFKFQLMPNMFNASRDSTSHLLTFIDQSVPKSQFEALKLIILPCDHFWWLRCWGVNAHSHSSLEMLNAILIQESSLVIFCHHATSCHMLVNWIVDEVITKRNS